MAGSINDQVFDPQKRSTKSVCALDEIIDGCNLSIYKVLFDRLNKMLFVVNS